jgi:hypothetical protein
MKLSNYLSLNTIDYIKGLVVAILSSIATVIYNSVQANELTFNWTQIKMVAMCSALSYICKNLMTNSQNQMLKPEPSEKHNNEEGDS